MKDLIVITAVSLGMILLGLVLLEDYSVALQGIKSYSTLISGKF